MRTPACLLLLACLPIAGCAVDTSETADSTEDELTLHANLELSSASGVVSMKSGAKALTCSERFTGLEGERVTCSRTGEKVVVIVKRTGKPVVVRDLDRKRAYYNCTTTGTVDGLPRTLKCTSTPLRPRGSGGLSSPFDSSVDGISVPNTHRVGSGSYVLRGMEPRTAAQFGELRAAGVKKVVIFKNPTGQDDVGEEIASWGLSAASVLHVPFKWKDLEDFETPCNQTRDALRFIDKAVKAHEKVFFHCTVGEDRTGYLAALYRVVFDGTDATTAFAEDMCEHGYASGNPQKPGFVTGAVDAGLTPLYRQMAYLVKKGKLTKNLEASACAAEPEIPADFMPGPLKCGVSTTLVP
jgi:hypothetical protein